MSSNQVTYWDYLKLPQLLGIQEGLGDEPSADEMHFIIVHQVFELWFKQIIKELDLAKTMMNKPTVDEKVIPIVVHHLKRVNTILESAIKHFDVMETLTPQNFLLFREKLGTASGFQSFQMREIEFLLGLEVSEREAHGHGDPTKYIVDTANKLKADLPIVHRINKIKEEGNFKDALHQWLYRTPIQGSMPKKDGDKLVVNKFLNDYLDRMSNQNELQIIGLIQDGSNEDEIRHKFELTMQQARKFLFAQDVVTGEQERTKRIRAAVLFIESYHELPLLSWPRLLLDTIVELEEQFVIFRFRHARMVERIIGAYRIGTGGSSGVDYLDQTTKYRIFKELWQVRSILLPKQKLPTLQKPEIFGFTLEEYLDTEK
ncbi:MAG: tryptophan 2,3-dioxygenase family protein [Candidatus Kariarchaeaceae archaeon]|jgi:tryptophan 2,3-dioxygenase